MPLKKRYIIHAIATVFAMAIFSLYYWSLAPVVQGFDSAELTVGAYTLGFIHPPGYPLYLLLGYVFSHLHLGSVGFNLNLMSAVLGGISIFVLIEFLYFQTRKITVSIISALIFAVNPYFWSQAIIAEVYTLHILLIVSILFAWFYGLEKNNYKIIAIGFLLLGVSTANHTTTFLLWLSYFIFVIDRKPLFLLGIKASILSLVIMLLFYSYFPIRKGASLEIDYIQTYFNVDLASFPGLLWLISGQAFKCFVFSAFSISKILHELVRLWNYIWSALLGLGVILSLLGFWELRRNKPLWNRFLTLYFLGNLLFFLFYDVVDKEAIFLPILVIMVVWFAHGLIRVPIWLQQHYENFTRQQIEAGFNLILIVIIIFGVVSDWSQVSLHDNDKTYQYALEFIENLEEGTVIVNYWVTASVFDYLKIVDKINPSIESFNLNSYFLSTQKDCAAPNMEKESDQLWFTWLEEHMFEQRLCFIEPLPPIPENFEWTWKDPCWMIE